MVLRLEAWVHDAAACLWERSKAKKLERADGVDGVEFATAAVGAAGEAEDVTATIGGAEREAGRGWRGSLFESDESVASTGSEEEAEAEAEAEAETRG